MGILVFCLIRFPQGRDHCRLWVKAYGYWWWCPSAFFYCDLMLWVRYKLSVLFNLTPNKKKSSFIQNIGTDCSGTMRGQHTHTTVVLFVMTVRGSSAWVNTLYHQLCWCGTMGKEISSLTLVSPDSDTQYKPDPVPNKEPTYMSCFTMHNWVSISRW